MNTMIFSPRHPVGNMNEAPIENDTAGAVDPQEDNRASSGDGSITVYFKGLELQLVRMIQESDIVVGCVAWLTSPEILDALSRTKGVSIVVQKEDFLRPDLATHPDWSSRLRAAYGKLPSTLNRFSVPGRLRGMSYCDDPSIAAVRCVGNHNTDRQPAFPRSHHKFAVFARKIPIEGHDLEDGDWDFSFEPYAVWTGSFNFTRNSSNSFENAVVIYDRRIVNAFVCEWSQVAALSEPLDWESRWIEPQWRIGS